MWTMWIMASMISVAGYYSLVDQEKTLNTTDVHKNEDIAANMALYKVAVTKYFSDMTNTEIQDILSSSCHCIELAKDSGKWIFMANGKLQDVNKNYLPTWYEPVLSEDKTAVLWNNYLTNNNQVIIYTTQTPEKYNITADILKLSQNSINVGVKKETDHTLYSPIFGDTGILFNQAGSIELPSIIPDRSPIWIDTRVSTN